MSKIISSNLGHYNILDYGADPTGTSDSQSAVQAACNAAAADTIIGRSRPVYVPPGRYRIDSTVNVYGPMYGANAGRQVARFNQGDSNEGLSFFESFITNGTPCIRLDADTIEALSGVGPKLGARNTILRDFCIYGGGRDTKGLWLKSGTGTPYRWTLERLQIVDCTYGLDVTGWTSKLYHCFVVDCRENALTANSHQVLHIIGGEYGLGQYATESPQQQDKWIMKLKGNSGSATTIDTVTIQGNSSNHQTRNNGIAISEGTGNVSIRNTYFEWIGQTETGHRTIEVGGQDLDASPTTPTNLPENAVEGFYIEGCKFYQGQVVYLGNVGHAELVPSGKVSGAHLEISPYCQSIRGSLFRGTGSPTTPNQPFIASGLYVTKPEYGQPVQNLILNPSWAGSQTTDFAHRGNWVNTSTQQSIQMVFDTAAGDVIPARKSAGHMKMTVPSGGTTSGGPRFFLSQGTDNYLRDNAPGHKVTIGMWYLQYQDLEQSPILGGLFGMLEIVSLTHDGLDPTTTATATTISNHYMVSGQKFQIRNSLDTSWGPTTFTVLSGGLTATQFTFDLPLPSSNYDTPADFASERGALMLDRRRDLLFNLYAEEDTSRQVQVTVRIPMYASKPNTWNYAMGSAVIPIESAAFVYDTWEFQISPIGSWDSPWPAFGEHSIYIDDLFLGIDVPYLQASQEGLWTIHPAAGNWHGDNIEIFADAVPTSTNVYHAVGDRVTRITPTAGGSMGWVCVTAGSPGTFKEFGAIEV